MLDLNLRLFYLIKPFIPRRLQLAVRRLLVMQNLGSHRDVWPINQRAAMPPSGWAGWPEGKRFALVLTHDVETAKGHERCRRLAALEESLDFRSVFNFVGEDYPVSANLRRELVQRGFEVGSHGLRHDGSLYHSRAEFLKQASRINVILKEWQAVGFRSPCMYRNLKWLHDLDIEYDTSTFDTDPFEPQPDGIESIFPLFIPNNSGGKGYVELPYTLPQDFTLFVLMRHKSIDVWKRKLDWIAEHGGLALIITHPDYMNFGEHEEGFDEYPSAFYEAFLQYVDATYHDICWNVLPRDVARFYAERHAHQGGFDSSG